MRVVRVLVVVAAGIPAVRQVGDEQRADGAVEDVLSTDRSAELELVGVSVAFAGTTTVGPTRNVTVTVDRPAGVTCPDLAARIGRRLERRTVRFGDRQQYRTASFERAVPGAGVHGSPPG